jgi:hypothetical protein
MGIDVERFERLAVSPLTKLESDRLTHPCNFVMEAELSCGVAETQDLEMGSPQHWSERGTLSK